MMKELWNKLDKETKFGGVFGIIAILAIIVEMSLGNFEADSVVGGIKDIFTTLISVVMLFVAIRALRPKIESPFSFEDELKSELSKFAEENKRMLSAKDTAEGNQDFYEYYMESDLNAFFGEKPKLRAGWFMRIPPISNATYAKKGVEAAFHLNQGTFFGHNKPENEAEEYSKIAERIKTIILRETNEDTVKCQYNNSARTIELTFNKPLTTKEDIDMFIGLIKRIYSSFLVLGNANIQA